MANSSLAWGLKNWKPTSPRVYSSFQPRKRTVWWEWEWSELSHYTHSWQSDIYSFTSFLVILCFHRVGKFVSESLSNKIVDVWRALSKKLTNPVGTKKRKSSWKNIYHSVKMYLTQLFQPSWLQSSHIQQARVEKSFNQKRPQKLDESPLLYFVRTNGKRQETSTFHMSHVYQNCQRPNGLDG